MDNSFRSRGILGATWTTRISRVHFYNGFDSRPSRYSAKAGPMLDRRSAVHRACRATRNRWMRKKRRKREKGRACTCRDAVVQGRPPKKHEARRSDKQDSSLALNEIEIANPSIPLINFVISLINARSRKSTFPLSRGNIS